MAGKSKYTLVTIKFAISPAPPDVVVYSRRLSFNRHTITPSKGPSKKETSTINTLPKSSFKNSAPKMG